MDSGPHDLAAEEAVVQRWREEEGKEGD